MTNRAMTIIESAISYQKKIICCSKISLIKFKLILIIQISKGGSRLKKEMIEKIKNNIEFVEEELQDYDPEQSNEIKQKKLDIISSALKTIYSYIEGAMGGSDQELENIKIRYRNLDHEYKELKENLDNSPDDRKKDYLG